MGHHTTKYYITNYLTLNWPARCLLILYKVKVLFLLLVESKIWRKKSLARLLLHFHTSILPMIEGFQDIFHPDSEFVSFFSPYLRPFKARPPAGVPANYRSLLSPSPFFFDQQIFRRGLLQRNNFPLHFSGRTKTPLKQAAFAHSLWPQLAALLDAGLLHWAPENTSSSSSVGPDQASL